jgi:hypothetical protein
MEKKRVRILSFYLGFWLTWIWSLGVLSTYWVIPIAKKHDKLLPVVELQRAFFAMTPASFVLLPLLINFEFLCSAGFAFTAKDFIRLSIHS